ncbi:MAG: hypothetical protein Q8880_07000 [Bacteroidota bacterium]|nr:hypothetical protein [Bacteroidota bacterium]
MNSNIIRKVFLIFLVILLLNEVKAQKKNISVVKDSATSLISLSAVYGYQYPGHDMANRFLSNNSIGAGLLFKNKMNWIFEIEGSYIFRDTLKQTNLFSSISTSDDNIIDANGMYAEVFARERGFTLYGKVGKILPVLNINPNSGPFIMVGAGCLEHKIDIVVTDNSAPQLSKEYKKGYDRLTFGPSFSESIGYIYYGKRRLINFFAAIEFNQAFTKNLHNFDYNTGMTDNSKRYDTLWGFKVGWMINLYRQKPYKDSFYF